MNCRHRGKISRAVLARCAGVAVIVVALAAVGLLPSAAMTAATDPANQTWVEIDGEVYGAKPDAAGPLGGGGGYQHAITRGNFAVKTEGELISALARATSGQIVFIDPAAELDFTDRVYTDAPFALHIPGGVTLASNRGINGSAGALLYSDAFQTAPLLQCDGPDVRITGLRLRGPDPKRRVEFHHRMFAEKLADGHAVYYRFPNSDGIQTSFPRLEVDNCEISAWSHAGVNLADGDGHHIHHNFIHLNQRMGLGYGVCLDQKANALIDFNIFQDNKHHIAGSGRPGQGYEACDNDVLPDTSIRPGNADEIFLGEQLFDMHGGRDRGDGTQIAGAWMKIHHNTFESTRLGVCIRGIPQKIATIDHNWFYAPTPGEKTVVSDGHTVTTANAYGPPPSPKTGLD